MGVAGGRWLALTALTVLFGIQVLRALVPMATFILRDRFGWHAAAVGLAMLAVFATGFLAAPVLRKLGWRRFLGLTAGGLGVGRAALQLTTGDPLIDLGLAVVAAILFFLALPALVGGDRTGFILGWLVGLAADTALHGVYGTWDTIWRADPAGLATILVLVGFQWRLLNTAGEAWAAGPEDGAARPLGGVWVAFGPLLFLELLVLGNVARLTTLTGWQVEAAATWTLAGRILACWAVAWSLARGFRRWTATPGLAAALMAALSIAWPRGVPAALLLLACQALAAMLWSRVVLANAGSEDRPQHLSASHGTALLTFGILLFLYYGSFDVRLPFARDLLPLVAALALGIAGVAAARSPRVSALDTRPGYAWLGMAVLLAPALIQLIATGGGAPLARPEVRARDAAGFPLRIMTYNLHLGLDPRGHLGLERFAAVIEAEDPDVVALQEVPRGWVVAGSADVLAWLARRLGMAYVFAPTADPLWGNAVLSRRPILDHQVLDLPTEDLLIRRGFLAARIGLDSAANLQSDGDDDAFEVIVTHHHHKRDGDAVREIQSRAILDFWRSGSGSRGRGRTAIVGDLNARPGEPAIEVLRDAGLTDVLDLAGIEPGYTSPATRPVQRIDYIWISPDLTASEVAVPPDPASDHLPVVATLQLR